MSDKETGGEAFPKYVEGYRGLTKRDYFAAKAMQGICAHIDNWGLMTDGIAAKAYSLADAMLRESAK